MYFRCNPRSYIPGAVLVNIIVKDILTDEQLKALSLRVGKAEVSIGEQLMSRFGNLWAIGDETYAKIKAMRIIQRNEKNIENISRIRDLFNVFNKPESYADIVTTTPNLVDVLSHFSGQVDHGKVIGGSESKSRTGTGDRSLERDVEKKGDEEEKSLFEKLNKYKFNEDLKLERIRGEDGSISVKIEKTQDVVVDVQADEPAVPPPPPVQPDVVPPPPPSTNISDAVPDEDEDLITPIHTIGTMQGHTVTLGQNIKSTESVGEKTSTKKGTTETSKMVKAKAIVDSLNQQVPDLLGRIINQLSVLFTDVRRCR